MQLVGQRGPLIGMGQAITQMLRNEGSSSLYLGLKPALTRSVLYGGLCLALYEPSKYVCELAFGSTNILLKIVAGGFSGSFATILTNPVEVVKVQLQMNSGTKVGAISEMCKIAKEEGIAALWKGVGPATARAAGLTASQLATYDETKRDIQIRGVNRDENEIQMATRHPNSRHFLTYRHPNAASRYTYSLRVIHFHHVVVHYRV